MAWAATYVWVEDDASIGLFSARLEPSAGFGPEPSSPWTSTWESCAAFQPVLAVTCTRMYRTCRAAKPTVTVLPDAGLNTRAAEADRVLKLLPSVLPWTASVWVRASQAAGSFSTTWSTSKRPPRSTLTHCGKVPGLSQYVCWLPSVTWEAG